jgi:hypothetical protein
MTHVFAWKSAPVLEAKNTTTFPMISSKQENTKHRNVSCHVDLQILASTTGYKIGFRDKLRPSADGSAADHQAKFDGILRTVCWIAQLCRKPLVAMTSWSCSMTLEAPSLAELQSCLGASKMLFL